METKIETKAKPKRNRVNRKVASVTRKKRYGHTVYVFHKFDNE